MENKKLSVFNIALIWFGAGVSLAEILTGTYFAPLGIKRGLAAILLGHLIGGILFFFAGLIGAKTQKSAMETVKLSFGQKGSMLFSILNVVQLIGWTAIMIYDGSLAAEGLVPCGRWIWCAVIGLLIILWIAVGLQNLGKVNTFAMTALFILTVVLCRVIFFSEQLPASVQNAISFGAAVELAVAMPLSWLPLISDYTRNAENPIKSTLTATVVYSLISCWMYVIGMGAAIYAGESDIAQIMLKAGLGIAGLLIVVFSTVTTTFLDAYSAGISSESISKKFNGKWVAIIITAVGTIAAILYPMDDITNFLYFIGSVFAPMIAVQIADYFILKKDRSNVSFSWTNIVIWFIGFILYRILMNIETVVGNTLIDMAATASISLVVNAMRKRIN